jgi:hypothetical protein
MPAQEDGLHWNATFMIELLEKLLTDSENPAMPRALCHNDPSSLALPGRTA